LLANTITAKSDFYNILTRETVVPSSRFPKLTKRLMQIVKQLPQLKDGIIESISAIDENYHAGLYDNVLMICNSLLKEIDGFYSEPSSSNTSQIIDKLLTVMVSRPEQKEVSLELLLGVYLTANQIEQLARKSLKKTLSIDGIAETEAQRCS